MHGYGSDGRSGVQIDRRRLGELVLYIAERSEDDPRFGATKLNKILYFSDFKAFGILGKPITGATYVRMERGPVPHELPETLDRMEREGDIERHERRYFNYVQKVVRAGRQSEAEALLSDREIEIVDTVLAELRYLNASQVSALSHLEVGWRVARPLEPIPYETVYIGDRQPQRSQPRSNDLEPAGE
jgi:uncharacterized phage-associated protein